MTLRRQENVRLSFKKNMFGSKGVVTLRIGARRIVSLGKMPFSEFQATQERQREYPLLVVRLGDRRYWQFRDYFYWDNEGLSVDAVHALLVTREQRQGQRISRAQQMVAMGSQPRRSVRGAIPDDVKQFVWRRDGGRCRNCGSRVELQFDHVIPVAMGGSSEPDNLQVLCGPCNRRKGPAITLA